MSQDTQLLELVKKLSGQVESLEREVKSLRIANAENVPEDVLVAIAAGVAAYLGYRGPKTQKRFAPSSQWAQQTKRAQLHHTPVTVR
ncbi:MAG: hypothetical protein LBM23_06115 [Propionibacteriaceae bacterium]|jgi:methylmalonyl-CoA carboxyltransferase large subunit|nr:hypothetical protein [Propionibacteriaceae bacterium]